MEPIKAFIAPKILGGEFAMNPLSNFGFQSKFWPFLVKHDENLMANVRPENPQNTQIFSTITKILIGRPGKPWY